MSRTIDTRSNADAASMEKVHDHEMTPVKEEVPVRW